MKYKIGDCFYLPHRQIFTTINRIEGENCYFMINDLEGLATPNLLDMWSKEKLMIPLKEDSEKERLATVIKYG